LAAVYGFSHPFHGCNPPFSIGYALRCYLCHFGDLGLACFFPGMDFSCVLVGRGPPGRLLAHWSWLEALAHRSQALAHQSQRLAHRSQWLAHRSQRLAHRSQRLAHRARGSWRPGRGFKALRADQGWPRPRCRMVVRQLSKSGQRILWNCSMEPRKVRPPGCPVSEDMGWVVLVRGEPLGRHLGPLRGASPCPSDWSISPRRTPRRRRGLAVRITRRLIFYPGTAAALLGWLGLARSVNLPRPDAEPSGRGLGGCRTPPRLSEPSSAP
jgi:hypothetical protein